MKFAPLLLALVVIAPFAAGQAVRCQWTTSAPDVQVGSGAAFSSTVYVINDLCQFWCLFSTWIYEEANGAPGLQRADIVHDDTCSGMISGDRIIF